MWEYKTFNLGIGGFFSSTFDHEELEAHLNELGAQGWELVSIFGFHGNSTGTSSVIATLKRPKS